MEGLKFNMQIASRAKLRYTFCRGSLALLIEPNLIFDFFIWSLHFFSQFLVKIIAEKVTVLTFYANDSIRIFQLQYKYLK